MSEPLSQEQEVWRGQRAQQLLDEPLIKEALDGIEAKIIEEWRATPLRDSGLREKLWAMYGIAHAFRAKLREHIETGKLAKLQLEVPRGLRRFL